jgi:hypothetical protein
VVAGEEVSNYMWIYIAFHFFPSNNISNKKTKCKVVHWPALAMYIWFQQLVVLRSKMPPQTHAGNLQGNICYVFNPKSLVNRKTHQIRASYNAVGSIGMPIQTQCKLHGKSTYLADFLQVTTSKW